MIENTPVGALGDDTRTTFQRVETEGIKLAALGKLIAVLLFTAYGVVVFQGGLLQNRLVYGLAFATLALALYIVSGSRYDRPWIVYVLAVLEVALLADAVLTPNPFNPSPWPPAMVFRYDNFYYFFVLIAAAVFSYRPALVMWTGAVTALAWAAGLVWVLSQDGVNSFTAVAAGASSEQALAAYVRPDIVIVSGRLKEILTALLVSGLLATVVWRGRRTVERLVSLGRERRRLEDLFGRFVPVEVARAVIDDRGRLQPEERVASILFVDLAGFTSIVEEMTPVEVLDMLNEYFTAASEIIGHHRGVITQYQGDAILASFNVPVEDPAHAQQAADAAVALAALAAKRTFNGIRLGLRVGVGTGPVVAGAVGSGRRMSYTVHGDTVNVAARLEETNKELGTTVLISQDTFSLLADPGGWEPIGEVALRGRRRAVDVYSPAAGSGRA